MHASRRASTLAAGGTSAVASTCPASSAADRLRAGGVRSRNVRPLATRATIPMAATAAGSVPSGSARCAAAPAAVPSAAPAIGRKASPPTTASRGRSASAGIPATAATAARISCTIGTRRARTKQSHGGQGCAKPGLLRIRFLAIKRNDPMARPDERLERLIATYGGEVEQALGPQLLCLALYGSAAGSDFFEPQSDVNIAVVVPSVTIDVLESLAPVVMRWEKRRFATPLL